MCQIKLCRFAKLRTGQSVQPKSALPVPGRGATCRSPRIFLKPDWITAPVSGSCLSGERRAAGRQRSKSCRGGAGIKGKAHPADGKEEGAFARFPASMAALEPSGTPSVLGSYSGGRSRRGQGTGENRRTAAESGAAEVAKADPRGEILPSCYRSIETWRQTLRKEADVHCNEKMQENDPPEAPFSWHKVRNRATIESAAPKKAPLQKSIPQEGREGTHGRQ